MKFKAEEWKLVDTTLSFAKPVLDSVQRLKPFTFSLEDVSFSL